MVRRRGGVEADLLGAVEEGGFDAAETEVQSAAHPGAREWGGGLVEKGGGVRIGTSKGIDGGSSSGISGGVRIGIGAGIGGGGKIGAGKGIGGGVGSISSGVGMGGSSGSEVLLQFGQFGGGALDFGAAGETESEDAGGFVESLAGGVVAGAADEAILAVPLH